MLKKWNKKYWAGMGVILALTGCTSVADMVGYDTATLNEDAAKSYSQVIQKRAWSKSFGCFISNCSTRSTRVCTSASSC